MKESIYLYCMINNGTETSFGNIGITDNEVYTVPFRDIGAVVHKLRYGYGSNPNPSTLNPKPSNSDANDYMVELVISHQHIIDMATDKFGSVIPFNPNRILEGSDEAVIALLKRDYIKIKNTLNEIEDKAEFGIQVFMTRDVMIDRIKCESDEFMRLKELNSGKAYVLGQRVLRAELEQKVDSVCKSVYAQISKCAAKIKINEITGTLMLDKQLIMNLSCLIHDDKQDELKGVLKEVDDCFEVRLSGPWQPYNFIFL
jgi:hypothetical protein